MVSDADMMQVQDAHLARLAELQLALAEKLARMAEASDEAAEVADLAKALEGTSRSVRLTYALRVKLRKDIRSLDREEARIAADQRALAGRKRWDSLRERVQTLTWHEIDWEEEDEEDFEERLDRLMDLESLDPAFDDLSLEDQADRLIEKLGLTPPPRPAPRPGPRPAPSFPAAPPAPAVQNSA